MENQDEKYYRACLTHYTVSRRGLLRGLFSGVNKAVQSSQQPLIVRTVPRPPSAAEEAVFLSLCHGCSACVDACPQQIIEMAAGYPQLNVDFNHCSHCDSCANVCKTGAIIGTVMDEIDSTPTHRLRADIGLRPVFSTNCNHRISGSCDACAVACPKQAISLISQQLPTVNNTDCIGCGQCRSACFLGAIQLVFKGES